MRQFTLFCGLRHLEAGIGRWKLAFLWPLAAPRRWVPWLGLATPRRSGGTLMIRLGPLVLIRHGA